jgi:hypothetical protein
MGISFIISHLPFDAVKKIRIALIVMMMVLVGCTLKNNSQIGSVPNANTLNHSNSSLWLGYAVALDQLMPIDPGLQSNAQYLAIDMTNLVGLSSNDHKEILRYFEKYNLTVREATSEQLRNETDYNLPGVSLSVLESSISNDKQSISISGVKYRGPLAADGIHVSVKYVNNEWIPIDVWRLWIS